MKTIPVKTRYIRPGEGYEKLIGNLAGLCEDDDYIIISETPVSTAEGNLVDESEYHPGIMAFILCDLWSKYIWGYILGPVLGYNKRTVNNLRIMPEKARNHKQFILERYGLKHALQPTSEAGVDLSNVPGEYVSLLPENPGKSADMIKNMIKDRTGKNVHIIIIDTDPTYEFMNCLFTTLPESVSQIHNNTGVSGYILRRFSRKIGPTILASTRKCNVKKLIKLAQIAENTQVENSEQFFETVYNMQDTFNMKPGDITSDMLDKVTHIPSVIIRFK